MLTGMLISLCAISMQVRASEDVSTWADDFRDMRGLQVAKHLERVSERGITISGKEQVWSLPSSPPFSSGTFSGSVVVAGESPESETVTLWSRVLQPGTDFHVSGEDGGDKDEHLPARIYPCGGTGFPGPGDAAVAGWGTPLGNPSCTGERAESGRTRVGGSSGSLLAWTDQPVRLAPGCAYAFSFLVGTGLERESAPVLALELFDPGNFSLYQREILKGADTLEAGQADFTHMVKRSLVARVPLSRPDPMAGFRLLSFDEGCSCVLMGPVYLTAQNGEYRAPLLDSLSSLTIWRRIEYSFDQNESVHAPDCACAPGSPVTPVVLEYGLSDSEDVAVYRSVETERGELGFCAIPAAAAGRYMAISVHLFGRSEAGGLDSSLAPRDPSAYFAGITPVVRAIKVRYFARAAEAVSDLVIPSSIRKWSRIAYHAEVPEGAVVRVDVLAGDGTQILSDIPADYVPGPELDVFRHHAIRLRARLYDNPNDRSRRPVLKSWSISWEREAGRLSIRPAVFVPQQGETVRGLVYSKRRASLFVSVHDGRGKLVRRLLKQTVGRGSFDFAWDGRSDLGVIVPPGEYYVTSTSTEGVATRKVRVAR